MSDEQKFHLGVKALVINSKRELLILKANPDRMKGDKIAHWDLPGGRIKEGHGVEETLMKEVDEELGVKDISIAGHFDSFISNIKIPLENETVGLVLFVYLCRMKDTNKKFNLSSEHTKYRWASIDDAKKLLSYKYPKSFIKNLDGLKQHKVRR